jgi:hypothetical protein
MWLIMNNSTTKTLTARFLDTKPKVLLELTNETETTLKSVEILTVFLKTKTTLNNGHSQAHIRFDAIKLMPPRHTAVMSHRTWIDGEPASDEQDQMTELRIIAGKFSPYVLDISWENAEGKARFQRIPVGH